MSALQAHELLKKKEISTSEISENSIQRIEVVDEVLNALLERYFARTREVANNIDKNISSKFQPNLLGLPIAVKHYNDFSSMRTTYGSTIFKNNIPKV